MSTYVTPANTAYPITNTMSGTAPDGWIASSVTAGTAGTVTLNGATNVNVAAPKVTANSIILFTLNTVGGTVSPNAPNVKTKTAGTGFAVAGTASDTSVYNWIILEPQMF